MKVGGFQIERPIARGGMGEVFEATQLSLGRKVALKLVASELSADTLFVERFRREARAAAAIEHPNILPVYETGEAEDGRLYMAMRLVRGGDLATLLREQGRLEAAEAVRVLTQVAEALDAAHDDGLIHRDVKPANVLLEQGSGGRTVAYLADFGLAKTDTVAAASSAAFHTRSGHVVGTVDYMAPEQVRGERLDRRADVYSFGCMLFAALTGVPPFKRDSDYDTMSAHINEPVPVPSQLLPTLPQALDKVVFRAMAKDSQSRAHSAGALMRWASGQPGIAAGSQASRGASRIEPRSPSGAAVVAPSGVSHSGTVADRLGGHQSAPDRRLPPTPPPPSDGEGKRKAWRIAGVVAAVLASAGLAVGAVLLLTGGGEEAQGAPFNQQLQRALEPLVEDNESVSEELEGLEAGDPSAKALRTVRATLTTVEEAGGDLEELEPAPPEQPRLRRAEELIQAEQDYLDAVGSVLNNPSSPRASELILLERRVERALSDLDDVVSGLEGSLTGAQSLIDYSRSRLDAREQRELQAAIAEQERQRQAAIAEQELEFTRQVDALLARSAPFTGEAASALETMQDAADGDDVGFPLSDLRNDLDAVIANRGDSAASARAITAPTEETRLVREQLAAYYDAAQAQGQEIRECLDDVEESDLSDISPSCVDGIDDDGASSEKSAVTADYNALRSRLGLGPAEEF